MGESVSIDHVRKNMMMFKKEFQLDASHPSISLMVQAQLLSGRSFEEIVSFYRENKDLGPSNTLAYNFLLQTAFLRRRPVIEIEKIFSDLRVQIETQWGGIRNSSHMEVIVQTIILSGRPGPEVVEFFNQKVKLPWISKSTTSMLALQTAFLNQRHIDEVARLFRLKYRSLPMASTSAQAIVTQLMFE